MPGFASWGDYLALTRDRRAVPADVILNETTRNNYLMFSPMMKSAEQKFQGGTQIVDRIQGESLGNFSVYSPNQEFSPQDTDVEKIIKVDWALYQSHYVIVEELTELNQGSPDPYGDVVKRKEAACIVDTVNGMEDLLWATPNTSKMEAAGADPRSPYSLLAFVTTDGLAPSSTNGGVTGSDWTTLQNLNPTNESWYRNKFKSYTAATPDDPDNGLIASFNNIIEQTKFEMPSPLQSYAQAENLQRNVIATSLDGKVFFKSRLYAMNDRTANWEDPAIRGPQFDGVPIRYVAALDSLGWTDNQPHFFFFNLNYIIPFFHTKRFMLEKVTDGGSRQPNTHVVWKFTMGNVICRSRRRQGRVFPA